MSSIDPTNPLHGASFYIEELKFGQGPLTVTGATTAELVAQYEGLLRDAGIELDSKLLVETLDFYGRSFERSFHVHAVLAKSIFSDGIMHGLALAAGLKGQSPA